MRLFRRSIRQDMNRVLRFLPTIVVLISLLLSAGLAAADDGTIFRKNVSSTPDLETEHAAIRMLPLYVPAQASDGTLLTEGIDYYNADGAVVETREYARPLIAHYIDGHVESIEEEGYGGFPGHGERDAYGAVSLDDGATWKRTNLSQSGDLSSFDIRVGDSWVPYPGDVGRTFVASDGNQVLVVWVSRYASGGSPNYTMTDDERSLVATYLEGTGTVADAAACTDGDLIETPCLYLEDHFSVAGSQGSSDLADEGYPLIGELPYAAVWAARGVMLPPEATGLETSTFVWFKAERLSSAVRDANRPEAVCVKGAGCVVTWQEDPDGIRPGEGEGPGEGWSGAIAHHQTDTWYSYIDWDDVGLVSADGTYGSFFNDTGSLADWVLANATGSPQAAVPMAIPVRLTDNAMCVAEGDKPYCYADFDGSGTADFCADWVQVTIETPEGPTQDVDMCITEDGRLLRGNTASTRARLGLHGYSLLGDYSVDPIANPIDSAWFYTAYEENKGLGDEGEDEETPDDLIDKVDMGKNVWYHTFDMFNPELVSQGLMLNQPAVYPDDYANPEGFLTQEGSLGYNFYTIDPDPIYETQGGLETTLYQSEISRRPSRISQDWYDAGPSGTVGFQLWKQGIMRRGGPADIMARRFVIPDEFDATVDNPYDYANMVCENADGTPAWAFTDGTNPRYVKGFCAAPAINLSGNTILTGETCADAAGCLDAFPFNEYFDDLDMTDTTDGISKILTWQQYGPGYDEAPPDDTNLDDLSWDNPYDMAKGHRGFLAGDMVMAMYAWTPNWKALTDANDIVNLYVRRSFDGGVTWSTLPASFTHTDGITYSGGGTTTCEWMGPIAEKYPVCTTYTAGQFEQARNVSQLLGSTVTVLDPRFTPTTRSITEASVSTDSLPDGFSAPLYDDDTRDPSRFFMVYETGHNSAYDAGEATPLDLFYSRAVEWGDHYLVWQDEADTSACLPSAEDAELVNFCNEFDAIEGSKFFESGEASVTCSPGGQFLYTVWNQWDFNRGGVLIGADAWFRRVLFLDDYIPEPSGGTGPSNPDAPKPGKP